jgi:hypothetical protein
MVFCIYYYYHELVKERADKSPHRQTGVPNRRAEDFTLYSAPVNTPRGGFFVFILFILFKEANQWDI